MEKIVDKDVFILMDSGERIKFTKGEHYSNEGRTRIIDTIKQYFDAPKPTGDGIRNDAHFVYIKLVSGGIMVLNMKKVAYVVVE